MDFLRRVLGLSSNSSAASTEDEITITHDEVQPVAQPEPVIDSPTDEVKDTPPEEAVRSSAHDTPVVASNFDQAVLAGTRPLPPLETIMPKPGQRVVFGQLSDVGMVRGNNQDAMLSIVSSGTSSDDLPDFGLFVVADGMGGHHDGEKASALTTRMVAQFIISEIYMSVLQDQMNDPDRPSIAEVLRMAIQKANDAVTDAIPEGGTTVTAAVILGDLAYIAHVGDSRAYMISDEGIEQITRDHSLVQRLIELDQLTHEEAIQHPQRNVLYRAIGQNDSLDVDAITRRLSPRARLLLCSDGLWNLVSEDTISEMINRYNDPQETCNQLVKLANERGGSDNITVVLIHVPG
ncbi:MAG: Stp1/IreP family PP2C-type Ser/Thr phosphatase [Chloroflexi bacterium]|nr:Stp1/IreP family PP2C-type Ser/Thr phosphatase [Chloroflexota bacterium]